MIYPESFNLYCKGLINNRLTSLRKSILYILWSANRPLKAYEILEHLLETKINAQPPTVYRVLDYFVFAGLVHKVESIQCYTLCKQPEQHFPSELLMVCNHCHQVQEIYNKQLRELIKQLTEDCQFNLGQSTIELKGLCQHCEKQGCMTC
ncbi:putative Ferric uptake regulator, Fur family [Legionella birminghamensis]|uniref:Fe2+/Zn2+ uptake regulation proteins n=1 Tax=Legionella birminghamensis TaxID=28083 RepID=A0A378I7L1_9GAMM|nr:transcriptional repressor [Legionella birminghamensis]KTC73782.1 putative Ferric uptake regulator, Fur family [Legionella birminghamensis]STX30720.1 Fe2+/Zn2+ uptake regulation proteins [Legionella birminghamensis]